MRFRFLPLFALAIAACSSSDSVDSGVNFCAPPLSYMGNEKHVGAGCTKGGNECARYNSQDLLNCAIDLDTEGSTFCIIVGCNDHDKCGNNACCTGREDNPVHACVPKPCLVENPETDPCPPVPGSNRPDAGTTADAM